MKFIITFIHMDGGETEIEAMPDDMEALLESIGKAEVYFSHERGVGFWIPIDRVRSFHVERVDEAGNRVRLPPESVQQSNGSNSEQEVALCQ